MKNKDMISQINFIDYDRKEGVILTRNEMLILESAMTLWMDAFTRTNLGDPQDNKNIKKTAKSAMEAIEIIKEGSNKFIIFPEKQRKKKTNESN